MDDVDLFGLDLNLLVVLDALITEKSVTRAGERVGLSQSATSAALSRLRHFFKDELLSSVGRRMVLTPLAVELADPVRDIVLHADALAKRHNAFDHATAIRRFRIMMSDFPATVLMPSVLARCQQIAPGVTFEIDFLLTEEQRFDRGDIDLLIMPKQWMPPGHPSEELFRDPFVCIAWEGNEAIINDFTLDQYFNTGHVAVQFSEQPLPVLEEWLSEQFRRKRRVEVTATAFTLLGHLLPGTTRIATVHRSLARQLTRGLPLRILDAPFALPETLETMQWHKHRTSDPGIIWLRSILRSIAAELFPGSD